VGSRTSATARPATWRLARLLGDSTNYFSSCLDCKLYLSTAKSPYKLRRNHSTSRHSINQTPDLINDANSVRRIVDRSRPQLQPQLSSPFPHTLYSMPAVRLNPVSSHLLLSWYIFSILNGFQKGQSIGLFFFPTPLLSFLILIKQFLVAQSYSSFLLGSFLLVCTAIKQMIVRNVDEISDD
jgi:hypothetical protein